MLSWRWYDDDGVLSLQQPHFTCLYSHKHQAHISPLFHWINRVFTSWQQLLVKMCISGDKLKIWLNHIIMWTFTSLYPSSYQRELLPCRDKYCLRSVFHRNLRWERSMRDSSPDDGLWWWFQFLYLSYISSPNKRNKHYFRPVAQNCLPKSICGTYPECQVSSYTIFNCVLAPFR